jgi:hypothetical protein
MLVSLTTTDVVLQEKRSTVPMARLNETIHDSFYLTDVHYLTPEVGALGAETRRMLLRNRAFHDPPLRLC